MSGITPNDTHKEGHDPEDSEMLKKMAKEMKVHPMNESNKEKSM
jgi:hypothetical protein